ncbi:MAG: PspC domain-containing protein [Verrucomicrobiota bacterium]
MSHYSTQNPSTPPPLRKPLYRSRNGCFLGVCKGLAEWRDISVFWIRLAVFIAIWLSGLWLGLAVYVIAGLIMKPEPVIEPSNDVEQEFYDDIASSRKRALKQLKRSFDQLDRRTRRLEHAVTSNEYDWERRLHSGR